MRSKSSSLPGLSCQTGIVLATVLGMLALSSKASAQPMNVLLITADDLGVQLGCYGDGAARTPALDSLAARGCLFENAYVAQASCSPSRSAMFTGLYPHTNGQYGLLNANVGFQLTPEAQQQTIPLLLKQAGYRTGILGKLHVGIEAQFPFDERVKVDTRDVRASAQAASDFFNSSHDAPWFLMANYADPHVQGRSPQFPAEAFPTQYKGIPAEPLQTGEVPSFPFQQLDHPQQIIRTTQYYNAASRFDYGVRLLLEELEASGHTADTLVIFVGDHGPPFFRGKTSCYEAGVHVPLLVVWPGVTSTDQRSSALVTTVDILPTILDATGVTAAPQIPFQGKSLRAAVNVDKVESFREFLATEFHYHGATPFFPRRTIRDKRFKLIHNLRAEQIQPNQSVDGDNAYQLAQASESISAQALAAFERAAHPPEWELYDLSEDPWEMENLAELPDYAMPLARMQAALSAWRTETNDPLLTAEGWARVARYERVSPGGGK